MNLDILLNNGVTSKQIERNGMIIYIDFNNINAINELLKSFGLKPTTSYDLVDLRLYTMDIEEIKNRLEKLKENHLLDVCYGNIENLIFNTDILIARINACKKNNIPIKDQSGYCEFLFNTEAFNKLGISIEMPKEELGEGKESNELIAILNNPSIKFTGFDENTFFKYQSLCDSVKHLVEFMPFIDYDNAIANLACLLKVPTNASDEELLETAILYNGNYDDKETEMIKSSLAKKESGLSL